MALPAHYGSGRQVSGGVEYPVEDPRAPGYGGVVFHRTSPSEVTFRLKYPQGFTAWMPARNVPDGLDRVHRHVSESIMKCARQQVDEARKLRKYPKDCPRCGAPPGQPCVSANSVLSKPHAARSRR